MNARETRLIEALKTLVGLEDLRHHQDEGPRDAGWQSDELQRAWLAVEDFLEEAEAIATPQVKDKRDEVALQIFCAFMSREGAKVDVYPELGDKQIRVAMELADNFLAIAQETKKEDKSDK